jgi:parallel beta-helix repeat protein
LFGCEGNSITGNIFKSIGLSSAIQLNFANRNFVNSNYIDSCVEGIQIWQNSNNNTVSENTITNCQDTAINFQYSNDNTIIGNNISRSGLGTIIYGSNRNIISNNNYAYNVVQFDASETYYLTFGHNRSVNTIDGNYWSDYTARYPNAKEIEKSGFYNLFWDTPYNIGESLGNYTDNHPLINPISFLPISTPTSTSSPISTSTLSPSPSQTIEPSPSIPEFPTFIVFPILMATVLAGLIIYKKRLCKTGK